MTDLHPVAQLLQKMLATRPQPGHEQAYVADLVAVSNALLKVYVVAPKAGG